MAYIEHSLFEDPKDKSLKLWRYIDFVKFVSLICTKSLFFVKAKRLQELDKFESSLPQKELDFRLYWFKTFKESQGINCSTEDLRKHSIAWKEGFEEQRSVNFINCWHLNETESMALWKIYTGKNNGIVIQTSINLFKDSFRNYKKPVFIGEVKYIDYENQIYADLFQNQDSAFNMFFPFITKHKSFEYEKEFRAIIQDYELKNSNNIDRNGILAPIDLNLLIEKIYIAPNSPNWYYDLVKEILEKYGVKKEVLFSSLDKNPPDFKI